ncbi:MAG: sigma-70 family RNA polymerase sigma factor [Planctomycetaceae bacterium]|nr:sigma-70 family RNA polymerase sigma factor [Planctomycetaceae bacterium]
MNESSPNLITDELQQLQREGSLAVARLFSSYRDRLERMIRFRMDARLTGRVDADDILQEAYLDIDRRLPGYLSDPTVPVFVWMRKLTLQALIDNHRRHLTAKGRSVKQESKKAEYGGATSVSLAELLIGQLTSPSHAIIKQERRDQVQAALDSMDELDREVLALRHFEQLTNGEVADVLGLKKAAASNRYMRALSRLKQTLDGVISET